MNFEYGHANVLANAADMSEDDWKDLRNNSIGSSDASAVLGLGRYGSPLQVWEAKTGRHTKDMNYAMSLGHIMEPVILGLAGDEIGMPVEKPDLVLQHPSIPEMTCNLDGVAVNQDGACFIVEAKHAGSYLKRELESWRETGTVWSGCVTEGWWVQVQHQMSVTGIQEGYLAALCDKQFFVFPIERDEAFIDRLETTLPTWFQRHVEGDEQPDFSGSDGDVVKRMFPVADDGAEPADMTCVALKLARARALKADIKALKEELGMCEVVIKAQMGASVAGFIDGERVITSKNVESSRISPKKLRAEYPEVAEACSEPSNSRRYSY